MTWAEIEFDELYAEPSRNGLTRPRRMRGEGYKMVNMGELFTYPRISNPPMDLVPMNEREITDFGLQPRDLLFARQSLVESGAGQCSIILTVPETTCFESHLIRVRLDQGQADPRFYHYYFSGQPGRARIEAIITGAAQKGIRGSELAKINVHHPALPVQRRIADILSAYDDLIENNNRRMALLEESIHLLYREWFVYLRFPGHERVKVVDGVPEGWTKAAASQAIAFNPRTKIPKDQPRPYVPMGSLSTNSMHISDIEERVPKGGAKFRNSDTLLARITPCLENGKTGFVQFMPTPDEAASGSTEFIVMRGETMPSSWVYCLARSPDFRQEAINRMSGSDGRQRVDWKALAELKILIPSGRVAQEFDKTARDAFRQIRLLNRHNEKLRKARDLLLPRLMDGRILV